MHGSHGFPHAPWVCACRCTHAQASGRSLWCQLGAKGSAKQAAHDAQAAGAPRVIGLIAPTCCSVLVANNGLGAVKFMRSIRSWANQTFGNSRAIALVAMATPEDIRINAEHVTLADQFVEVCAF